MQEPSVRAWIEAGDLRGAASFLVVQYAADVLAACNAMLRDRAAAEDIAQEVFGDAMRGLSTFRGDASARTWLLAIARNRCIDYLRAKKRDPWGGAPAGDDASDPDAHADEGAYGAEWFANRSMVTHALDALAEGDRALIVLRFKNGLEYDELASAFGLREGTVRMRVSRALARMREVIAPEPAQAALEGAAPLPPAAAAPLPMPAAIAPLPPMAAPAPSRARAAAPPAYGAPPGGAPPMGAGAPPPPAAPRASWWDRLKAWAFGAPAAQSPGAPVAIAPPAAPIASLGRVLADADDARVSESFAARLGALVQRVEADSARGR